MAVSVAPSGLVSLIGASIKRAQALLEKSAELARDADREGDYTYTVGIMKKALSLEDSRPEAAQDLESLMLGWPINAVLSPRPTGIVGVISDSIGESLSEGETSPILIKLFLGEALREMTASWGAGGYLTSLGTVYAAMVGKSEKELADQLKRFFPNSDHSYIDTMLKGRK